MNLDKFAPLLPSLMSITFCYTLFLYGMLINKDTVLFYSADNYTLDNIASFLTATKTRARKELGKNIILKLCDKRMPSYIDNDLMSI